MELKTTTGLSVNVEESEAVRSYRFGNNYCNRSWYVNASDHFESAAAQGYPAAYLWLGWLYGESRIRIGKRKLGKSELFYQKAANYGEWFKTQAKTGEADAQRNLGYCYEKGIGVKQNFTRAAHYYHLAAEQGYAPAQNHLGCLYHKGMGVEQNFEQSIRYFELAADQNYAMAKTNLGICYQQGSGVEQDFKKAVYYYQLAAENDLNALTNLGFCYHVGQGIDRNISEARNCYYRAAYDGHALAKNNLGVSYETNLTLSIGYCHPVVMLFILIAKEITAMRAIDEESRFNLESYFEDILYPSPWERGYFCFKIAANAGNAQGQSKFGDYYRYGVEVKRDVAQALHYYRLSADQGNADGQSNLGLCYKSGEGVEKDFGKALHYFRLSAAQGNANGQNNLGNCYKNGEGVEKDIKKALHYYRLAVAQGCAEARNNLGNCYKNGEGVEKDLVSALHYYRMAVRQRCASAQVSLGDCYREGEGVKKDIKQAVFYYEIAAEQNNALALYRLAQYYESEKKISETVYYYQFAANLGHVEAQYQLGVYYGDGVSKDIVKARDCYHLLIPNNNVEAHNALAMVRRNNSLPSVVSDDTSGRGVKASRNQFPALGDVFLIYLSFLQGSHQPTAMPYRLPMDCTDHIFSFFFTSSGIFNHKFCNQAREKLDQIYRDQTVKQSYLLIRHGFFCQPHLESQKPLLFALQEKLQLLLSRLPIAKSGKVESVFLEQGKMVIRFNSVAVANGFYLIYSNYYYLDECLKALYPQGYKFDLLWDKCDTRVTFAKAKEISFFIEKLCNLPALELYKECPNFKPDESERCVMM